MKTYTIATVAKVKNGHAWFKRMEEGIKKFEEDTGHTTFMVGPPKTDEQLQVKMIEDVMAQGVDALCVVPFLPQALEMVLAKARRQGIVVISHEASNQRNVDYDIEAFDNAAYGAHLMDRLAKYMGAKGKYVIFVECLTVKSHSEWATAAIERQRVKYPDMELGMCRIEDYGEQDLAYTKAKDILKTIPNLKGILGCTTPTIPGVSRAIEEAGLQSKIAVVGNSIVSVCKPYLKRGTTNLISSWDPADAGYMMNKLAVMVLEGDTVRNGMDFGVPGYKNIHVAEKIVWGNAMVDVTQENMTEYHF